MLVLPCVVLEKGVTIEDASNHAPSLVAFEEMLEFLVIRLVSNAAGGGGCHQKMQEAIIL